MKPLALAYSPPDMDRIRFSELILDHHRPLLAYARFWRATPNALGNWCRTHSLRPGRPSGASTSPVISAPGCVELCATNGARIAAETAARFPSKIRNSQEDCVNAFRYGYEALKDGGAFAAGATLAVCPWEPEHQLVRVAIKGREIDPQQRPASNLVFLIDVSGSMQSPDKLPLLKQSMATLVNQLDECDRVAIVVYAGSQGVVLPSTRLDSEGRPAVLNALTKLEAGGSTNGGAGIQRAYEMAMKEKIEGGVNRVILATDGDFNVGVTGQDSLVEMVKERAQHGVSLTVLGYGSGNLNDSMMDAITRDGNGNYFYIDSEREGQKVFMRNLAGTLVTLAKDVKIQIEFNPAMVGS